MTSPMPSPAATQATTDRRAFVACTVIAVVAVGALLAAAPPESTFDSASSITIPLAQLTAATVILLVTISAIFLQRWRAGTEGGSIVLSAVVGLMAFGSLDLIGAADGWNRVGVEGISDSLAAAARITSIALLAFALIAGRSGEPRPSTVAAWTVSGFAVSVVVVAGTPFDGRTPGGVDLNGVGYASGAVLAWTLLVLGALSLRRGRIHHQIGYLWMGVLAVVMGTSNLVVHHVSAPTHADFLGGIGLMAVGTGLVAAGFHNDLVRIEAAQNSRFHQVEIEAETRRVVLEAERNDRAVMAHDSRSALLAIEGGLRFVAGNRAADTEISDDIYRALTQELARLRRLLSGRELGEARPFLVADAIEAPIRLQALVDCDIVVDASPDARAYGDVDATREIVQNLLDNAVHHGRASGITVRVVEYLDSITITVSDQGPGVPEPLHAAIFERGVTSKSDGACGLGLHSSRELASKMNGTLHIDPLARGASFTLTLPVGPATPNEGGEADHSGTVIDLRGVRAV